jgi:hypothetical protein
MVHWNPRTGSRAERDYRSSQLTWILRPGRRMELRPIIAFTGNTKSCLSLCPDVTARQGLTALFTAFASLTLARGATATEQTNAPLMHYSHSSKSLITFVARGDLWTVPIDGGTPKRRTNGPGQVLMPRFSLHAPSMGDGLVATGLHL